MTGLNHERGEAVEPVYDFGEWGHDGLEFFHAHVDRSRLFKGKPG